MKSYEDYWWEAYIASLQSSRSQGPIAESYDSSLFAGRATNDANAALEELKNAMKSGKFKL